MRIALPDPSATLAPLHSGLRGFINPITKTDWEGTGVEPDIKVPAGDALDEALRRARSGL